MRVCGQSLSNRASVRSWRRASITGINDFLSGGSTVFGGLSTVRKLLVCLRGFSLGRLQCCGAACGITIRGGTSMRVGSGCRFAVTIGTGIGPSRLSIGAGVLSAICVLLSFRHTLFGILCTLSRRHLGCVDFAICASKLSPLIDWCCGWSTACDHCVAIGQLKIYSLRRIPALRPSVAGSIASHRLPAFAILLQCALGLTAGFRHAITYAKSKLVRVLIGRLLLRLLLRSVFLCVCLRR